MRCYRSQSLGNGEFNDSLSIMVTNRSIMFRNRFTGFKIVARFNILSQYTSRRHGLVGYRIVVKNRLEQLVLSVKAKCSQLDKLR